MQAPLLFILSLILASSADFTLKLTVGRNNIAAASVGTKAIFAGGLTAAATPTSLVNIYDVETKNWTTASLSFARSSLSALTVGTQVLFSGGAEESAVVEIYNSVDGTWTTKTLTARTEVKGTVVGTKAFFGGGKSLVGAILGVSDLVDIYDSDSKTWTTETLLTARLSAAVTSVGTKALFIGGVDKDGNKLLSIDVYDTATSEWSKANLTVIRTQLAAVSVGGLYAVIAGGVTVDGTISNVVEIYNGVNWTTATLPQARAQLEAATDGVRAWFIGGVTQITPNVDLSNRIDIYNPETKVWTTKTLSQARLNIASINVGAKVFVAGGGSFSDLVEVFEFGTTATTPTPTPGVTPTPTPTNPSPNVGPIQCRLNCKNNFEDRKDNIVTSTHFTDRCKVWTDYRVCLAACADSDDESNIQEVACKAERWIGDLCDCDGDGWGQPDSLRLIFILNEFKDQFLSYFNDVNGVDDADFSTLITLLRFTFSYDNVATNMDKVSADLKVTLGLYLNQKPERFVMGNTKRAIVDGELDVEVVEPADSSSATGVTVTFVFFFALALFHLF